jgi:hypothetical protein
MGMLSRGAAYVSEARGAVPQGSKRDRLLGAIEGGLNKTDLLAGKYLGKLPNSLSPSNSAQYAPLAYGLISAGGSVAGNLMGGEDKDPGRILLEAAGAATLGGLVGSGIQSRAKSSQLTRANVQDITDKYGEAALPYIKRGTEAAKAGATSTAKAAFDKAVEYGDKTLKAQKYAQSKVDANRLAQGLYMGALPALAGLGGLLGGGVSNVVQMTGIPGFQQGMAIDPESPGSSNTASAKYGVTPYASTQYV